MRTTPYGIALMSLLYRAGALLIKAGLGLVRATEDCWVACCRPWYCCSTGGDVGSFCTQDECPPLWSRTGPFATEQQCEDYCGSGPPEPVYCCWNSEDRSMGSTCQVTPCAEGMHRSGPHASTSQCIAYCDDPPDPQEYYWCCCPGTGFPPEGPDGCATQSCVPGEECEGYLMSGPYATPADCAAECAVLGACCPPYEPPCATLTYNFGQSLPGRPGSCSNRVYGETTIYAPTTCPLPVYVRITGSVDDELIINGQVIGAGQYPFPPYTCNGAHEIEPPHIFLLTAPSFQLAVGDNHGWYVGGNLTVEFRATPFFDGTCLEQQTLEGCDEIGGSFFPNQACYSTPCPGDCYGEGTPSPCPGSVLPPADECVEDEMRCAPSVTATIAISGVQCLQNSSGICTSTAQALADACNNTFILDRPEDACWFPTDFPFAIGGHDYRINLSIVPSLSASPPAAANTICYKVYFSLISLNFGPCPGTGGQAAESANHCGVAPVVHTLNCDCTVWRNCAFTASGSLTETFDSCHFQMVELSNAQFSLVIA